MYPNLPRLDSVQKLPHRTFGRAATAALKSAVATPARFGTQNTLEDHGKAAACRKWGSKPNACRNCGAEVVAWRGTLWTQTKRSNLCADACCIQECTPGIMWCCTDTCVYLVVSCCPCKYPSRYALAAQARYRSC